MWNPFKKKEVHECDDKVLDSQNVRIDDIQYTRIMLKCECGDGRISTIKGKWSKVKIIEWYK